jgi:hypothetical protein
VVVDLSTEADSAEQKQSITELDVPSDVRLLQLAVQPLFAKSLFGRARAYAVKTLRQYRVEDDEGQVYFAIGECRLAEVGGQQVFELQYWPRHEQPERALRDPRRIRERDLERGGDLTYLFLIPPGRRIVKFTTGTAGQMWDLTEFNLVAPE